MLTVTVTWKNVALGSALAVLLALVLSTDSLLAQTPPVDGGTPTGDGMGMMEMASPMAGGMDMASPMAGAASMDPEMMQMMERCMAMMEMMMGMMGGDGMGAMDGGMSGMMGTPMVGMDSMPGMGDTATPTPDQ